MNIVPLGRLAGPGLHEDLDLGRAGEFVAVVRAGSDLRIVGPGWSLDAPQNLRYPIVRLLDSRRVVLVETRTPQEEPNAWILDRERGVISRFFAGDAIADVRVSDAAIAFTYFDEAYSSSGPAGEGVSFFDLEGRFLWGYRSQFGDEAVDTMDVYAACTDEVGRLWFFPYDEFPLVRLDIHSREQKVFTTPTVLEGSGALSIDGDTAYFASPYGGRGHMFEWSLGTPDARRVARIHGDFRGLSAGRFLVWREGKWSVVEDLRSTA
jgi:hypothetical protein